MPSCHGPPVLRTWGPTVSGPAVWGPNAGHASSYLGPSVTPRRPEPAEEGPLTSTWVCHVPTLPIPCGPPSGSGDTSVHTHCLRPPPGAQHGQVASTPGVQESIRKGSPFPTSHAAPEQSGLEPLLRKPPSAGAGQKGRGPQPLRLLVPETALAPLTGEPRATW